MASKLRPLYDKIYVGVEAWLLARESRQDAKKYARLVGPNPRVDAEYASTIRPYWRQFKVRTPKKYWFRLFANENRPFSPQYIPDDLWYQRIIPYYNNLIAAKTLQDKCMHSLWCPDVLRPTTVVKRIAGQFYDDSLHLLTQQEAAARCHDQGRVIVKPSVNSGQGHGIRFFETGDITDQQIEDIFQQYGNDFIIQKKMSQHPELARLNPSSINSLRVISFLHDDQVHILASILRVGSPACEMDNTAQGGLVIAVRSDGRLERRGQDKHWQYMDAFPNGIRFEDVTVPSYDKILDTVKRLAARLAKLRLIGWDIAVSESGEPMLIEFNAIPAQAHSTSGPLFGELTDQVLEEVFGRRDAGRGN